MTIITHATMGKYLDRLQSEPEFQCGSKAKHRPGAWYRRPCYLEFPIGELAKDGLASLALVGFAKPETMALDGGEGFNAQGLEGKARIRKDLFMALMNLRDILPEHRGRILVDGPALTFD